MPSPIYGFGLLDATAAVTASVPHVTANPMGDLGEWIHIHRRAEPTAAPSAGGSATVPTSTPRALPPDRAVSVGELAVPRWDALTLFWIPFTLIAGFVILVSLGVAGAVLHFRRAGRRG